MALDATEMAMDSRPCELARYTTDTGEERMLVGQLVDGAVRITDRPCHADGRRYFVEEGIDSKLELAMLVADYRRQADQHGCCPMSGAALDQLVSRSKALTE